MSLPLAEALRVCRLHLSALQGALLNQLPAAGDELAAVLRRIEGRIQTRA